MTEAAAPREVFTVGDMVQMARRAVRAEPGRVLLTGLIVFGISALANSWAELTAIDEHSTAYKALLVLASAVSTIGLTFYAGLLDRLVGAVEEGEEAPPLGQVLRTLPYGPLLVADLVLWLLVLVAAGAAVVGGMVLLTLFAIVGPLINMEGHGVFGAFVESARLVKGAFVVALLGVTLPWMAEQAAVDVIEALVPHEAIGLLLVTHIVASTVFGVFVGLMEVSLAEHLVHGAGGHAIRPPPSLRSP